MWSIGVYDYRLRTDEFWRLTPAQFHALGKRFDADRKHQDLGFGIVTAMIANTHRDPKQRPKPFTAEDFMPVYETKKKSGKDLKMYWDTMVRPTAKAAEAQRAKLAKRRSRK